VHNLPIDSILRLMTVWRIRGKIIRTAITVTYTYSELAVLGILGLGHFCVLCSISGYSVKVKLLVTVKLFSVITFLCIAWKGHP